MVVPLMKIEENLFGNEKNVLRWGGLAGILGGIAFIFTIVIFMGFLPARPATIEGLVMRYPDIKIATTVAEVAYFVAVISLVPLILALYRALRGSNLAPALFGSGLSFVGLVVYATGALPVVALSRISDLYHASGATSAQQATAILLWQGIQGIFNETDTVGFVFFMLGIIVLGVAMIRTPTFGKVFGALSVIFGLIGAIGISLFAVDSTIFSIFAILAFIVYPLLFGWKAYRLSMAK
jgi:hypothetical protein